MYQRRVTAVLGSRSSSSSAGGSSGSAGAVAGGSGGMSGGSGGGGGQRRISVNFAIAGQLHEFRQASPLLSVCVFLS